jgi:hypothetical protein
MAKSKEKITYVSVRTVSGETFSGQLLGFRVAPKSGMEIQITDWTYFFPIESLSWWATSSKTPEQIAAERAAKLKAEAKKVVEKLVSKKVVEPPPESEITFNADNVQQPPASSEKIAPPISETTSLRAIAAHQAKLPSFTREELRPRAKRTKTLDL